MLQHEHKFRATICNGDRLGVVMLIRCHILENGLTICLTMSVRSSMFFVDLYVVHFTQLMPAIKLSVPEMPKNMWVHQNKILANELEKNYKWLYVCKL